MEIISGHDKLYSRYLGQHHDQLHTDFLTNFIPWTGHDLRQVHDLDIYVTSASVIDLRQGHDLGKVQSLCFNFFQDHGFLHDICPDYDLAMTMTLP